MDRRNNGWASASILLRFCVEVDKARSDYEERRDVPRIVLGNTSETPLSKRSSEEYIEVVDNEYWLSELDNRLKGWRRISQEKGDLPVDQGFLSDPRLHAVRKLRRKVRVGAM